MTPPMKSSVQVMILPGFTDDMARPCDGTAAVISGLS
jgi:hypothetical protein